MTAPQEPVGDAAGVDTAGVDAGAAHALRLELLVQLLQPACVHIHITITSCHWVCLALLVQKQNITVTTKAKAVVITEKKVISYQQQQQAFDGSNHSCNTMKTFISSLYLRGQKDSATK